MFKEKSGKDFGKEHGNNAFKGFTKAKIPFCWEPFSG
jgi:hypothetical protein